MNGARRLRRSTRFAYRGLSRAWREQPNLRLETFIGACATLLALWLGAGLEAVLLSSALVLSLELMNSAVEALVDLVSPGHHPLAAAAKDLSAAAVLVASAGAAVVGLVVLGPPLLRHLGVG
ncbi:MAG TPA: diacylglycerol kinase [Trueperaceae bacterium]